MEKEFDNKCNCFDKIPAYDGQTDSTSLNVLCIMNPCENEIKTTAQAKT